MWRKKFRQRYLKEEGRDKGCLDGRGKQRAQREYTWILSEEKQEKREKMLKLF